MLVEPSHQFCHTHSKRNRLKRESRIASITTSNGFIINADFCCFIIPEGITISINSNGNVHGLKRDLPRFEYRSVRKTQLITWFTNHDGPVLFRMEKKNRYTQKYVPIIFSIWTGYSNDISFWNTPQSSLDSGEKNWFFLFRLIYRIENQTRFRLCTILPNFKCTLKLVGTILYEVARVS